jgi:PAS domain-containing protein
MPSLIVRRNTAGKPFDVARLRLRKLVLLLGSALLATLAGCGSATVILWTDRSEAAPIVELFNAQQQRYVVELRYEPDVSRALRLSEVAADVVIAGSIEDDSTARLFRPLDRLLGNSIRSEEFYEPLLANGVRSGKQLLLPLSFNLPLVFFAQPDIGMPDDISLGPEQMRSAGVVFNELEEDRADRIGFSPLWDGSFLYEMIRLEGLVITENDAGEPEWSLESLLSAMNVAIAWVEEDNGGVAVDAAFREQYLYDPIIRLVQQGRVLFGFDTSESYFTRSDDARSGIEFRWLGKEGNVPVLESIVYAGIPDRAVNRSGAEAFLSWLFDVALQTELLTNNRRKRIDTFGVVGGFSSLWRVTERSMPDQYPALQSMIPPAGWMSFPPPSPRHWERVVEQVVQPWLLREAAGLPQSRDLASSVSAWLLQQEE